MTEKAKLHLLVAGVTTRALAISAARAGYRVTAIDAFGDLDLGAVADLIPIQTSKGRRFHPAAAARAGETVASDLVAYTSNLENHPGSVERLARHRELLGNPPEVLRQVRNPIELMRFLRRKGFQVPESRVSAGSPANKSAWLLKPRRSGGGHGIRSWRRGSIPRGYYLQERIGGVPGSVIFAANGHTAIPLGVSRQLVGNPQLGASGFRYCGSLLGSPQAPVFSRQALLLETATAIAAAVSEEYGLVGLNGLDFVARNGVPYPIEVNPRYSASMELVERAGGLSMFEVHLAACRGTLPTSLPPYSGVHGKAIVFAKKTVTLRDTGSWLLQPDIADVPHAGERIARGRPICTVFATAEDETACRRSLFRRAAAVHRAAEAPKRRAA